MSLQKIQSELKAPKGQFNGFGKYKYRSCEDIVESVKPILAKYNASLVLSDSMEEVGGRVYVKATATITFEKGETVCSTAFAREPEMKKGMDESQITGTASSYARKYALNGLLAIDDTKDADSMDNSGDSSKPVEPDKEVITKFEQCDSVNALQELWKSLDKKQHPIYNDVKNQAKERLAA